MRKTLVLCTALLALAAAMGGIAVARYSAATPAAAPAAALAVPAATPVSFTAAVPPASAAAEAPPAPQRDADLPTIEVKPRLTHAAPDDDGTMPARPVILHNRDGRVVETSPPPHTSRSHTTAAVVDHAALGGAAQPIAGPILSVAGRTVHLFGVRAADARERCASGRGAAASCAEAARAALAARLSGNPSVTCNSPPGQQSDDPGFICHDATGADLGGLLVAEGLALVDRRSSFQYLGAEDTARLSRRGLWSYR
jgi:endonuclease YncB( thermonuclease family)